MKIGLVFLYLIPISLILTLYARFNISFAEFILLKYILFCRINKFFTSKFSFSLAEIIIVSLFLFLIIYLIFVIIQSIRYNSISYIRKFTINLACFVSLIYFFVCFYFCGINYYRFEFTHYSGLEIKESSANELVELCEN